MVEIKPFKDQDYISLKSQHDASNLFVDPEFPADLKSLSHSGKPKVEGIEWKRPKEIFGENARFVVNGYKRGDLDQGKLGDCWFVAACAAVTLQRDLLTRVVPPDQSLDNDNYAGIFHFRFWLFGVWYDVVIDDLLPCLHDKLIFCRNKAEPNELWVALLEKAYAKVCGSYEAMVGGSATDALIDMSAGLNEKFQIFQRGKNRVKSASFKKNVKRILHQAYTRKSMLGCDIHAAPSETEHRLPNGLLKRHAYSITKVKDMSTKDDKKITLIRCRNPWGNKSEWNGDWSDHSELWDTLSDKEKAKLNYQQKDDGEFWMSFDDFYSNFHAFEICHRGPSSLQTTKAEKECLKLSDISEDCQLTWQEEDFHGEWIPGETAGGRFDKSDKGKFWTNPQYLVKLIATDDVIVNFDDDNDGVELCTMIVSLMQKDPRQRRVKGDLTKICIQFFIARIKDDVNVMEHIEQGRIKFYQDQLEMMDASGGLHPCRSVTKRFRLPPGTYVIIPYTSQSDQAAKFLLRIFTEKEVDQTVKTELDRNKTNPTEDEVTFTEKDFNDLIDGVAKLLDELDDSSSKNDPKEEPSNSVPIIDEKEPKEEPSNSVPVIDEKEPKDKEELCSLQ